MQKATVCNCKEFFDGKRSYRILIADGPREPYSQEDLPKLDPVDEELPEEERREGEKLAVLRQLGQMADLIGGKQADKIASLDIQGIEAIHYPGDMIRYCHCIVSLDKSAISATESRLKEAGYSIK